jgi:hypothetical protein
MLIAKQLGVAETDVVDMNCRLGGDVSLNVTIREDSDSSEWQGATGASSRDGAWPETRFRLRS